MSSFFFVPNPEKSSGFSCIMNICSLSLQSELLNNYKLLKNIVMPGLNKTGPQGAGPMTGRRMGYCADNENQSRGFFGRGRGFGGGQGAGRGFGMRGNYNTSLPESTETPNFVSEINSLKDKISSLVKEIAGLKNKNSE